MVQWLARLPGTQEISGASPGVTVYLDPLGSLTPGGQASSGYLDPTLGILTPTIFFL